MFKLFSTIACRRISKKSLGVTEKACKRILAAPPPLYSTHTLLQILTLTTLTSIIFGALQ